MISDKTIQSLRKEELYCFVLGQQWGGKRKFNCGIFCLQYFLHSQTKQGRRRSMRGSRHLLRAQVHNATDTKPLSGFSNPNCFVKAILGDGDGSNPSNIYECRKNNEKESYLCDLELTQRSCAAEPTLYRNMRFLDLGARDCYLTTSASSL